MLACSPCSRKSVFSIQTSPLHNDHPSPPSPSPTESQYHYSIARTEEEEERDGQVDACPAVFGGDSPCLAGGGRRRGMLLHLGATTRKARLTSYSDSSRARQHHCCGGPYLSSPCRRVRSPLCANGCSIKVRFSSTFTTTTSARSPASSPSLPTPHSPRSGP